MKRPTWKTIRFFLFFYSGSIIVFLLLVGLLITLRSDIPKSEFWDLWKLVVITLLWRPLFYFITLVPYLLFQLGRSWVKDYQRRRWSGLAKGVVLRGAAPILLIWLSLKGIDTFRMSENYQYTWDTSIENMQATIPGFYKIDQKQRGIHVFNLESDTADIDILLRNNIEWITLTPFIPQDYYNTPSLSGEYRDSIGYFSEWATIIEQLQARGFKIMLKPHIWLLNTNSGKWRSDISMASEDEWQEWFEKYELQILAYAQLAATYDLDLFCIGAELRQPIIERPKDWENLIQKVRDHYSGPLTYAANWNEEIEHVSFWKEMDFIGIQAYYPIAKKSNPSLKALENGWKAHLPDLAALSAQHQKPILFTEIGYKSTPDAGVKPWAWNTASNRFYKKISHRTQVRCYRAFFNVVWPQEWMAGVHLWEWQSRGRRDGMDTGFQIEGKPALNEVAKGFYLDLDNE